MLKLLDEDGNPIEKPESKPEITEERSSLSHIMELNNKRTQFRKEERSKKNKEVLRAYRIKKE